MVVGTCFEEEFTYPTIARSRLGSCMHQVSESDAKRDLKEMNEWLGWESGSVGFRNA